MQFDKKLNPSHPTGFVSVFLIEDVIQQPGWHMCEIDFFYLLHPRKGNIYLVGLYISVMSFEFVLQAPSFPECSRPLIGVVEVMVKSNNFTFRGSINV